MEVIISKSQRPQTPTPQPSERRNIRTGERRGRLCLAHAYAYRQRAGADFGDERVFKCRGSESLSFLSDNASGAFPKPGQFSSTGLRTIYIAAVGQRRTLMGRRDAFLICA